MEQIYNLLSGVSHHSLHWVVNGLWVGLILTGLVFWGLRYARAVNAATRYLVWWSLLAVVVALPLLMAGAAGKSSSSVAQQASAAPIVQSLERPAIEKNVSASARTVHRTQPRATASRIERSERPVSTIPAPENDPVSVFSIVTGVLPLLLFSIWISVVSLQVRRLWTSLRQMTGIKRRSRLLDVSHLPRLEDVLRRATAKRPVRVCLSAEVEYPMAAGLLGKPTILIPQDLVGRMSDDELEAVVLHELAHILRWDDWTKLGQKLVEAVMCFHPAVHWIGRQLDLERELACDDQVVVQTGKPGDYARCLTRLVQLTTGSATSLVPGALTSRKQIVKRFERLLLKKHHSGFRFSTRRFVGALVPLVIAVAAVVQLAPVVALPIDNLTYGELTDKLQKIYAAPEPITNPSAIIVPAAIVDEAGLWDEPDIRVAYAGPVDPAPCVVYEPDDLVPTESDEFDIDYYIALAESEDPLPELLAYDGDVPSVPSAPSPPSTPSSPSAPSAPAPPRASTVGGTAWVYDDGNFDGTMITRGDGRNVTITWSDGSDKLAVTTEGVIVFTDDDRGIKSISPGGYLGIEEKRGRTRRELEVEADADGNLDYGYYEKGKAREFDDKARAWMGEVLLQAIRKTGLGAEARASRILKKDGADGLLAEVSDIESDYVKRIYLDELLKFDGLREQDHASIVKIIARDIDSDYEKAELLINVADRAQKDPELLALLVQTAETIDSDYEVRRVLSELILDEEVDEGVVETVLRIASRMDSDYEKAELLIDMSQYCQADQRFRSAYILAVKDLDSDYESRRVLTALNLDRELDAESIENILLIAADIDSDYEKAELLIDLSKQCRGNDGHQRILLRAISTLDSDYERRRVLSSLPFDCKTTPELAGDVLLIAGQIDSDYEKAELLAELAECATVDRALAEKYVKAVSLIDSDYETKKVLQKLISSADLKSELIADILRVIGDLDSDYEKSEILKDLVDYCRGDDVLEEQFIDVIESMDSDYEIDKLYSLLYRRGSGKK